MKFIFFRILVLILFLNLKSLNSQEEKNSELYYDKTTGQIYLTPGENREKLNIKDLKNIDPNKEKDEYKSYIKTPISAGFSNTPNNPLYEKLTIVGRVQFRGVSGQYDSIWSNGKSDFNVVDWNMRRVRMGLMYMGDKWWGTAIQLRLEDLINRPFLVKETTTIRDSSGNNVLVTKDVNIRDNRGGLQEASIWLNIPIMNTKLTFGQMPMPFLREWMQTSANLINVERTFTTNTIWQMDLGFMLTFMPLKEWNKNYEKYLVVYAGVFNGHGSGLDGVGRGQVKTYTYANTRPILTLPMYVWRIQVQPFGGLIKDGKDLGWFEGEEIFQKEMKLSLGYAGMETNNLYYTLQFGGLNTPGVRGYEPFNSFIVQSNPDYGYGSQPSLNTIPDSLGRTTPTQTNYNRPSFGLVGHTADFTFTWNGFYLNGAYTVFSGSASKDIKTYNSTIGYNFKFLEKFFLMPIFRYDFIEGDFNIDRKISSNEIFKAYWLGLNFFGEGHLFKAQLFYQIFRDKVGIDPLTTNPADARNNVIYFQVQASFWTGTATAERMNALK